MVKKPTLDEIDRQIMLLHKTHAIKEIGEALSWQGHALEDPQIYNRIKRLIEKGLIKKEDLVPGTRKKLRDSRSGGTTGGRRAEGVEVSPYPGVKFHGSGGRIRRGRRS